VRYKYKLNPKVLIISCNWDGWSCIETASISGLQYPSSVRIAKVSCLSRVHAGLILKAFKLGADGVMLLGCEPGNCHFNSDNECINKEYEKAHKIMSMLGIRDSKIKLVQLPAFEGQKFIDQINEFLEEIEHTSVSRRSKTSMSGHSIDVEVTSRH
jgi:F420-non-reducing hydrogenase iron-sulfur subunit